MAKKASDYQRNNEITTHSLSVILNSSQPKETKKDSRYASLCRDISHLMRHMDIKLG